MTRYDLLQKVKHRKSEAGLTIENIAKLSGIGNRTVTRFLAGEDVKISTVEKVTTILGLDFSGNEILSIDELREKRARQKAMYMVSLVQDTSSLEQQGLNDEQLNMLMDQATKMFLGQYKKSLWSI